MRWAIGLLVVVLSGCNHFLARELVSAPNAGLHHRPAAAVKVMGSKIVAPVGPPAGTVAAWIVNPAQGALPRGTVLVLHGFLVDHGWMRYAQEALSGAGYRVIMVDLPGHGESSAKHITFGAKESRDLSQLLDVLEARGLVVGPVGVYGVSLGAATAIDLAARDQRVRAVVSVSSYASLAEEIPHYGKVLMPLPGRFLSAADYAFILGRAEEIAGFSEEDADPVRNIGKIKAPILLLHGTHDAIVPEAAVERLHAANPEHSEVRLLKGEGHIAACYDWSGEVMKTAIPWLAEHLK